MTDTWNPRETTTHQHHVIAHVIDTSVLGYFIFDEALYILLDIGFLWTIFLDCEMALLPHPVAMGEIEIDERSRSEIKVDIDRLLGEESGDAALARIQRPPVECQIRNVGFFEQLEQRRLILEGEQAALAIETSLSSHEIKIYEFAR